MEMTLDVNRIEDYRKFLAIKGLPIYRIRGSSAWFPDEYAERIVGEAAAAQCEMRYAAPSWMWDYQKDITPLAIRKRKFAVFMDCGYGKTPIHLEFAKHAKAAMPDKSVLIVAPLMVIRQELQEIQKFYKGEYQIEQVFANNLQSWLNESNRLGIVNYEAITQELTRGKLGGLILVESSMLKSHYGKWGTKLIEMGRGLDWKLCETGTPAPNDRIEYANHAVFLDAFPTVNSFLAKFFVNRGQTCERWELKPHALEPFYRALSHWSIFVSNPATYGWKDNCANIPPIHVHIHDIELTDQQHKAVRDLTGQLFMSGAGGIGHRSTLGRIGKGSYKGEKIDSNKNEFIKDLVESWPEESTIIWCMFNSEQDEIASLFPDAANISGTTPMDERLDLIDDFKAGRRRVMISKSKILGWGLNLQKCTRMVFSGLQDSYEAYYQCVKRANRVGSTRPLNVHIPITETERPMVETVLRKAKMVQQDTEAQERIFKGVAKCF